MGNNPSSESKDGSGQLRRYTSNASSTRSSRRTAAQASAGPVVNPTSISPTSPSTSTSHHIAVAEVSATSSSAPRPSPHEIMGNADSKPSRSSTLPIRPPSPSAKPTPPAPPLSTEDGESQSHAHPVDVPPAAASAHDGIAGHNISEFIPSAAYSDSPYGLPPANYSRPPRLPLPIEEELHTPGSPIITPQDITTPLEETDIEGGVLPRKTSVLSSTTADDDELGDEAFGDTPSATAPRIPVKLEWNGAGEKIFVTGTFCNWEKKVKLPRNKDNKPGFSTTIYLPPGTHHVKFLVDGEMYTSPDWPTTVDWTNFLVNYIEIVLPKQSSTDEKQAPEPAKPMPIPGAALTAGQATGTDEPAARPLQDQTLVPETEADLPVNLPRADGSEKPAEATASIPIPATPTPRAPTTTEPVPVPDQKSDPPKPRLPRPKYTSELPQYLLDLDNYQNPEDERYIRAQHVANSLPQPPSLPMFLNKSILNGTTPHKDDASVLIMPNHTVLNHLATSSIKGGVLATSGTTRYKRKFLTTIMYKPTSDNG